MAWAIFDKQKRHIIDFFVGTSDECWKYIVKQQYNCGKIASMDDSAMELHSVGWRYINGMWVSPKSKFYSEF